MLVHAHFQLGQNGQLGVAVFFALSGFLITTLLLEEFAQSHAISIKGFYIRRTFRLFPALYVMLAILVLYAMLFASDALRPQILAEALPASLYVYNIASLWGWQAGTVIFGHTWSLAVEEQFYILWPWILLLALQKNKLRLLTMLLAFFITGMLALRFLDALPEVMGLIFQESIFLGCLLALLRWQGLLPKQLPSSLLFVCMAVLLAIGVLPVTIPFSIFNWGGLISLILIYGVVSHQKGWLAKWLSHRWLVFIGKISYALYLWHLPIFRMFGFHSTLPPVATFVLKFAVTFVVAYLSWHFLEKHAIAKGRQLSGRMVAESSVTHKAGIMQTNTT